MTSIEAFLGAAPLGYPTRTAQGTVVAPTSPMTPTFTTGQVYTAKEFAFDRDSGLADPHVAQYLTLATNDKASGSYDASTKKLKSFLVATRDALRNMMSTPMTDTDTQKVVDIIGRLNLVLEITRNTFPNGLPVDAANAVNDYVGEINDLNSQLMERRKTKYQADIAQQIRVNTEAQEKDSVPGGGAAGPAGSVISDEVEKTTMQKVGPVLALAAGGLAAYLALR